MRLNLAPPGPQEFTELGVASLTMTGSGIRAHKSQDIRDRPARHRRLSHLAGSEASAKVECYLS